MPDEEATLRYVEWIDRARGRDRDALGRLYEATYLRVFAYLLARTGERAAAEDLLQDVYLAALQAVGRFRGRTEAEFVGWLLKIARAKVSDRLRGRYRHPEVTVSELPPRDSTDPLDTIEERLRLQELAEALGHLTEEQRDVVVSRFVMGFDLEETGLLLRKNANSIKALQHRGLARLARILRKEGHEHA
ncbi:MAG: sigma-70 family RNA polymerase sigma factor [Candidatus Dormibacteraeota bacterium]|nr:sigma-70 family RNA polymerase sigma factor [Candidatus Dormibacteraeota bacterium]